VRLIAAIALCAASVTEAAAEAPVRDWSVAAPIHATLGGGLGIEAERQIRPRVSVGGLGVIRSSTAGDYSSLAFGLGAEVRWWLTGWTAKSPLRESVVGAYLGTGLELARVRVRDDLVGAKIGSTTSAAVATSFGYRFAPFSRASITPNLSLALGRDMVPGPAPGRFTVRVRWGLTFGALF